MKKDPQVFLKHILESIEMIEQEIGILTESEFKQNITVQDAVTLIHNYFGVDLNIVWDTVTQTLPEFKKQIEALF